MEGKRRWLIAWQFGPAAFMDRMVSECGAGLQALAAVSLSVSTLKIEPKA